MAAHATRHARLTLICHAETAANRQARFPIDEALNAQGHAAAQALKRLDQGHSVAAHVLVAPERRARETADAMGLTSRDEAALRDCDYGHWRGRSLADLAVQEAEALAEWMRDPAAAPHGGEAFCAVMERVAAWMDTADLHGDVLAICSAPVVRAAAMHALQAQPQGFWRMDVAPLSCVKLTRNGTRWAMRAPLYIAD